MPVTLGAIETGEHSFPMGRYQNQEYDVMNDGSDGVVPILTENLPFEHSTPNEDHLNRPKPLVLEWPEPRGAPTQFVTNTPFAQFPSIYKDFPGFIFTKNVLLDVTSRKRFVQPFKFSSAVAFPFPPPALSPRVIHEHKPKNPWLGKNWIYRNSIAYLAADGQVRFESLQGSLTKSPLTTTLYCSQTGDPELVVPFNGDVGPFRRAAM